MSRVIVCANQKGGVAKTTTTVNLGIGLAKKGMRVLVIDNDPQSSLTVALGFQNPSKLDYTMTTVLKDHHCPVYDRVIDSDLCYESIMCLNRMFKTSSLPELKEVKDIDKARDVCKECPYSKL